MNQMRRRAKAILQLQGFLEEIHYFRGGTVTVLANTGCRARQGYGGMITQKSAMYALLSFAPYPLGAVTE